MEDLRVKARSNRTKTIIGSVSSLLLVVGLAVGLGIYFKQKNDKSNAATTPSPSASIAVMPVGSAAVVSTEVAPSNYVPPWVQSELASLKTSIAALQATSGTSNYLCPLNATSASGQCVSIDASGQVKSSLVPYAKMTGGGAAFGFTSGVPLLLPKYYVEGGMTYMASTGQVVLPWTGRYEVNCMITIDINKAGYVSIARNGAVFETYGRLYQNNASDSSNGYIGSNTFALPAKEKISLVLTKQGTNSGSIQGNPQDTWWTIRYIGPIVLGESV